MSDLVLPAIIVLAIVVIMIRVTWPTLPGNDPHLFRYCWRAHDFGPPGDAVRVEFVRFPGYDCRPTYGEAFVQIRHCLRCPKRITVPPLPGSATMEPWMFDR